MEVYMFEAELYCKACGEDICNELKAEGEAPADPTDEHSFDSDDYPKGPYPNGGGEADCPQHCGGCYAFLENPLTPDGYEWLRETADIDSVIIRDEDGVDIEASAKKAQDAWDANLRHGGDGDEDAPLAQWIRYYPEAWN